MGHPPGTSDFAVARYTRRGRLDARFGSGGKVLTSFGSRTSSGAADAALQPDGKIVAVGSTMRGADQGTLVFALVRYTRAGALDRTFGVAGKVRTGFGPGRPAFAVSVAIQDDGKIVVAGNSKGAVVLARYLPDGRLDPGFGDGGKVSASFPAEIWSIAIQNDGNIVAVGQDAYPPEDPAGVFAVTRLLPDGRLDPTFGAGGEVRTAVDTESDAFAVAIQEDGKIVAAGYGGPVAFALARYNPDGSLDASFGNGGTVTGFGPESASSDVLDLAIQPDGKIVAAGDFWGPDKAHVQFGLARYLPDGNPDPSFGTEGKRVTGFGSRETSGALGVAIQRDHKIVAAGSVDGRSGAGSDDALARYLPDGRLDRSFGAAGKVVTDFAHIASLSATTTTRGVLVRWRTGTEAGTQGFNVYEQRGAAPERVRANQRLIKSKGTTTRGASYTFLDKRTARVVNGYLLQEITRTGKCIWYGPAPVKR